MHGGERTGHESSVVAPGRMKGEEGVSRLPRLPHIGPAFSAPHQPPLRQNLGVPVSLQAASFGHRLEAAGMGAVLV